MYFHRHQHIDSHHKRLPVETLTRLPPENSDKDLRRLQYLKAKAAYNRQDMKATSHKAAQLEFRKSTKDPDASFQIMCCLSECRQESRRGDRKTL